jgi:hypothetical protein
LGCAGLRSQALGLFFFDILILDTRSFQVLLSLLLWASPLSAVDRCQLLGPAQLGSVSKLCPIRGSRQCDLKVTCTGRRLHPEACDVWMRSHTKGGIPHSIKSLSLVDLSKTPLTPSGTAQTEMAASAPGHLSI